MLNSVSPLVLSWKKMNAVMTRVRLKRKTGIKEERKMQIEATIAGAGVKTP